MSDVVSVFDPIVYIEAFPSLKYAFALGAMVLTLRWIGTSWKQVRSGAFQQSQITREATQLDRVETKINLILWNIREVRQEMRDLMDVVRPGIHRRPLTDAPDEID